MPGMKLLQLRFLGGFSAGGQDGQFDHFATDKVRGLLAYMAIESHQAHRRSHLAALFWPDWDERSALSNLRKSLFRLRQSFEFAAPGLADQILDAARSAVSFQIEPVDVDVLVFQDLLAQSEHHGHSGTETCPECRTRLVRAVELYKGDLLAGLSVASARPFEEWLTVRQERLHRQALDTLHLLTVAYQSEGEYEAAIAYANRQLALEPWRETAHRRLMTLLAATGQEEQAIRQYEKCRAILAEELGVMPAAETEYLLKEIKAGRGRLVMTEPKPKAGRSTPGSLNGFPAQATTFVGRQRDVEAVVGRLLDPEVRLVTLVGYGGTGKTSLAAASVTQLFAGPNPFSGAWFISLDTVTQPHVLATTIGRRLGISFSAQQAPEQQVIDFLNQAPILLVLDNYEPLLPDTLLIERILDESPQTTMLVTSRLPLNLRAERRVPLMGLLAPEEGTPAAEVASYEAVRLLETIAQQTDPQFLVTPENADAIGRISRRLAGLPLALEIAGHWLQLFPPDELADRIEADLEFLVATRRDMPERHRSLQVVFAQSWSLLSAAEQAVFARLTCFQGSFTPAAAKAIAGASIPQLAALLDHALLRRHGLRYSLHPVVRESARAYVTDNEELGRNHARWFLREVADASPRFATREAAASVTLLDQDLDDIRVAWQWAVGRGEPGWLSDSLEGLLAFYQFRGLYEEGREVFATAADAAGIAVAGNLRTRLHLAEATLLVKMGRPEKALDLAEAAHADAETTDTAALLLLGQIHESLSQFGAAISYLEMAMKRLETQGDTIGMARGWNQIGHLHRRQGSYERSIAAHQQSLALYSQLGNDVGMAENHAGLGLAYKDSGEFQTAARYLMEARRIAVAANHREYTARFAQNLGLVYWQMDRLDEALACYQEALAIAEEIRHPRGMAHCLGSIGILYRRRYEYSLALHYYERALAISEQIRDEAGAAFQLGNIGNVYMDLGQFNRALDYMHRALAIDRRLGVLEGVGRHLGNIGDTLKDQGRFEEARPYFDEGISVLRQIGSRYYLCWQLSSLAEVMLELDQIPEAYASAEEGLQIAEAIDRRMYHFQARLVLARLAAAAEDETELAQRLAELSSLYDSPEERAEIALLRWELRGEARDRADALLLFTELYAAGKLFRYRNKLSRLGHHESL